jgi:hypothetical protein
MVGGVKAKLYTPGVKFRPSSKSKKTQFLWLKPWYGYRWGMVLSLLSIYCTTIYSNGRILPSSFYTASTCTRSGLTDTLMFSHACLLASLLLQQHFQQHGIRDRRCLRHVAPFVGELVLRQLSTVLVSSWCFHTE